MKNDVFSVSSPLNCTPERSARWPFIARIQPFSDTITVTGSRSTIASAKSMSEVSGKFGERRAAFADGGVGTEGLADLLDLPRHRLPLLLIGAEQVFDRGLLVLQALLLALELHLLELAQASAGACREWRWPACR